VGLVYGISTAGSIAGTLATNFWLIPISGIQVLVLLEGGTLVVVGLATMFAGVVLPPLPAASNAGTDAG
jgi:hypothetical protein